jgi:hypothetical protein
MDDVSTSRTAEHITRCDQLFLSLLRANAQGSEELRRRLAPALDREVDRGEAPRAD